MRRQLRSDLCLDIFCSGRSWRHPGQQRHLGNSRQGSYPVVLQERPRPALRRNLGERRNRSEPELLPRQPRRQACKRGLLERRQAEWDSAELVQKRRATGQSLLCERGARWGTVQLRQHRQAYHPQDRGRQEPPGDYAFALKHSRPPNIVIANEEKQSLSYFSSSPRRRGSYISTVSSSLLMKATSRSMECAKSFLSEHSQTVATR